MHERTILDHPFLEDFALAYQAFAAKELGPEGREALTRVYCNLFPEGILTNLWPGWQIGIPRPDAIVAKEALRLWEDLAGTMLYDFFKRVACGMVYCDRSVVVERYGRTVEEIAGRTSGAIFNLESAYWTFNVKFGEWIEGNTDRHGCTLVCFLDEILARFDSRLRAAFFPTTGPGGFGTGILGRWARKRYQKMLLGTFAPDLKEQILKEIWA